MWALYLLVGIFVTIGVFVLGARYGRQIEVHVRDEADKLKQEAERLKNRFP